MTEIVGDEEVQNTHIVWLLDDVQKKFVIFIPSIGFFLRWGECSLTSAYINQHDAWESDTCEWLQRKLIELIIDGNIYLYV